MPLVAQVAQVAQDLVKTTQAAWPIKSWISSGTNLDAPDLNKIQQALHVKTLITLKRRLPRNHRPLNSQSPGYPENR